MPPPTNIIDSGKLFQELGEHGLAALVKSFYARIPKDDILGPMYPKHDLIGAEERLRDFLIFRFGGPSRYLAQRGHPRLRMRHMPFPIDQAARDRWIELMTSAIDETIDSEAFPQLPALREPLIAFFDSVATFLINRAEPS